MENKKFFGIAPEKRFMICNLFFLFFIQGFFVIMIGSILPMMRDEYNLSYQIGGILISAHNVGNVVAGLVAGFLPMLIGMKTSIILVNLMVYIGFFITLITGNPVALIFAIFLTGLGRGGVSNYDNQVVSSISPGSSAPLNALHGFFAIGAVISPMLTLFFTRGNTGGWRNAVYVILLLGLISTTTSCIMRVDAGTQNVDKSNKSLEFLKERAFIISLLIMFCYQAIEATIMGWLVSYYTASSVVEESFTQMLTSILWVVIFIGRFICTGLGMKIVPRKIIRVLSVGIVIFLAVLLRSTSLVPMLIGTIGLGLSFSGMFGTTTANAGDVFMRYPLAMGFFIFLSGFGAIITPTVVGAIAEVSTVRMGMTVLLLPAVILLILAFINKEGK